MYANYSVANPTGDRRDELDLIQRINKKIRSLLLGAAHFTPTPRSNVDQPAAFAGDLGRAIRDLKIESDDHIFFHTADGSTYLGLSRLVETMIPDKLPTVHIVTPYDPVGVMPNCDDPEKIAEAVRSFEEQGLRGKNIFLYGENELLAKHLASLWSVPVRSLLIPAAPAEPTEIESAKAYRRDFLGLDEGAFVVVSLGSARMEKGFDLLPDIIQNTLKKTGNKVKFVLHASPQIIGRHPVIAETIDKLGRFDHARVRLLLNPLSLTDYRSLLLASDAVMLPYNKTDYLVRSSAVVSEAISSGKILIATADTYPGMAAIAAGGLTASTPSEFGAAISYATENRKSMQKSAMNARDRYLQENSISDYVKKAIRYTQSGV